MSATPPSPSFPPSGPASPSQPPLQPYPPSSSEGPGLQHHPLHQAPLPAGSPGEGAAARRGLELKPTQLAGGALAAVTSAVAASYFGVAGTVIGAAFGSVVSSVAAAVYAHSLTRAGQRIRTVVVIPAAARGGTRASAADPSDPAAVPQELTGARAPIVGDGAVQATGPAGAAPGTGPVARVPPGLQPAPRAGRRLLRPALALGGFALAASLGAITATELAIGHPISRAGDGGTSLGSVVSGDTGSTTPRRAPAASPTSVPGDASPSPSGTAHEPSPSLSVTPSGDGGAGGAASPGTSPDGPSPQPSAGDASSGATPVPTGGATGGAPAPTAAGGAAAP